MSFYREHSALRHLTTLIQPVPATFFLLQPPRNCQGWPLSSQLPEICISFAFQILMDEIFLFFLSSTSCQTYSVFFFWESELTYHQGRKKVIPYLPVNKLPLAAKIQQHSLTLWINVLLALTNPRSMDSHCSLQVSLIFSLWFLFPWSKEILGSFFDPAFEECACLLWVCLFCELVRLTP